MCVKQALSWNVYFKKKYKYFRHKSIIVQEPTFQIKKSFQRGMENSMQPTLKQRPAKVIYVQRPPLAQLPLQLTPLSQSTQSTQCTFNPFDKSLFPKSKFTCNLDTWRTSLMQIFFVFFFHHHLNNNSIYSKWLSPHYHHLHAHCIEQLPHICQNVAL